jgi:competence protein ComEC
MPAARTPPDIRIVALALLAGAVGALAMPAPLPPWAGVSLVALVIARAVRAGTLRGWMPLALGFALASLHAAFALDARIASVPARHHDVIIGRVATLPRVEPRRVVFEVDVEAAHAPVLHGRRVRIAWYHDDASPPPDVRAGERWRFGVRLKAPRGLRNPGGSDAERHALADRLAAIGYVLGQSERLGRATGLQAWRERMSLRIAAAVPAEASRFVRALAIGDTRGLTDHDWRVLRADGLTHLIAISGFHVGMVAGAAALVVRGGWWLLPWLAIRVPARIAGAVAGLIAAGAYAAAAGLSMPTVRTLLMIAVVVLARVGRRAVGVWDAVALAVAAIVAVDPLALLGAGFWLSFAGVAWLAWCLPREQGAVVRGLVRAQAVASIALLPLGIFFFDQASIAGPIANLVAVPLWSLVVAPLAVGGVVADVVSPSLADAAWTSAGTAFAVAWPLFERMGESPLALVWIAEAPLIALPLACAGATWLLLPRGLPGRALAAALWLPLLWPSTGRPRAGEVEVTALDVGQGLAVLVRTRTSDMLYDAGPAVPDGFDAGERAVVPALRARGVRVLDHIVVSHGDNDHAGGLRAVLAEIPARARLAPEGAGIDGAAHCRGGMAWSRDGVGFRVLHPPRYFPYLANESSCVLRIETAHGAVLLTGDIGDVVERRLLASDSAALRADVVFAGHHGSRHSSDPAFVAATHARHVVFSTGHANRFRHPAADVEARWRSAGARAWNTADTGAVTIRVGRRGVHLAGRREQAPRLWDAARIEAGSAGLSYRRD